MGKRIRLTNGTINSYGTRILTSGLDITQFQRNPVLLYMHTRGSVIGYVKDIRVEGDEVTGELEFDEASTLSVTAKKQFEFGSLRMVSVGIDILATSSEADLMLPGQNEPTITRSKLFEVSIVDIGANDDAIVLTRDGRTLECGKGGLETFSTINNKSMDTKALALKLGLPEGADEAAIQAKIDELRASTASDSASKERDEAVKELETMRLAAVTQAVDAAVSDRKINADQKEKFMKVGQAMGLEALKGILSSLTPTSKVSSLVKEDGGSYAKLSEVPGDQLETMREKDTETYKRLYKAEYGIECQL